MSAKNVQSKRTLIPTIIFLLVYSTVCVARLDESARLKEVFRSAYSTTIEAAEKDPVCTRKYTQLLGAKKVGRIEDERQLLLQKAMDDFVECLSLKKECGKTNSSCFTSLARDLGAIHVAAKKIEDINDEVLFKEKCYIEAGAIEIMKSSDYSEEDSESNALFNKAERQELDDIQSALVAIESCLKIECPYKIYDCISSVKSECNSDFYVERLKQLLCRRKQ